MLPARRLLVLVLALLVLGTALGGCARVRAALALQPDDTVNGEIVIATPEQGPDDKGPTITVPADLQSDVDVSEYRQDGYTGSVLRFDGLTFEQVGMLTQVAGLPGNPVTFELYRAGNRVKVDGRVDLKSVSVDRADFQLKISFQGDLLETNGRDADTGTVSWTFTAGEVNDFNAVIAHDDPNAPSALNWTIGLGLLVAAAAAGTVWYARQTRNPPVSPPSR
ncbi:MAG TPA: DUF3153 domain-containing protein [Pseudonocardia sp.]|nr:DUF3153 domain-containing protein [Pseudonocardia sp.]